MNFPPNSFPLYSIVLISTETDPNVTFSRYETLQISGNLVLDSLLFIVCILRRLHSVPVICSLYPLLVEQDNAQEPLIPVPGLFLQSVWGFRYGSQFRTPQLLTDMRCRLSNRWLHSHPEPSLETIARIQ